MTANPNPAHDRDPEAVIASANRNKALQRQLDQALADLERGNLGTPLRAILREERERQQRDA